MTCCRPARVPRETPAAANGLQVFHVKRELHDRYLSLLLGAPLSATAIRDPADAWERHVGDALTAMPLLAGAGTIVDVGSGRIAGRAAGRRARGAGDAAGGDRHQGPVPGVRSARTGSAGLGRPSAFGGVRASGGAGRLRCRRLPGAGSAGGRHRAVPAAGPAGWASDPVDRRPGGARSPAGGGRHAGRGRGRRSSRLAGPNLLRVDKLRPTPERFPRRPGMARKRPLASLPSTA